MKLSCDIYITLNLNLPLVEDIPSVAMVVTLLLLSCRLFPSLPVSLESLKENNKMVNTHKQTNTNTVMKLKINVNRLIEFVRFRERATR